MACRLILTVILCSDATVFNHSSTTHSLQFLIQWFNACQDWIKQVIIIWKRVLLTNFEVNRVYRTYLNWMKSYFSILNKIMYRYHGTEGIKSWGLVRAYVMNWTRVSVKVRFTCHSDLISSTMHLFLHPPPRWPIKENTLPNWAFEAGLLSTDETKVKRWFKSLNSVKTWLHFSTAALSLFILGNNCVRMQDSS